MYGKEWVVGYVSMWLIELNDSSNVKTKMTDAQIEFTSERIYDNYSLKVTDLTLFFRNVKEGVYGQYYENLSQEKIMDWIRQYYDLRCEYGQIQSQSTKTDAFKNLKENHTKEELKEGLEIMFKGVGDEQVVYDGEKNGLGSRVRNILTINLPTKIKSHTTKELRDYLTQNHVNSNTYDEIIYNLIEQEIDFRNEKNQKTK